MTAAPHCITVHEFVRRPRRFLRSRVRRTQETSPVRQHWELRTGRVSPGTGRKNPGPARIFRPVPGLAHWQLGPTAVRRGLVSVALRALAPNTPSAACRNVGRAILPAAGFQPAAFVFHEDRSVTVAAPIA